MHPNYLEEFPIPLDSIPPRLRALLQPISRDPNEMVSGVGVDPVPWTHGPLCSRSRNLPGQSAVPGGVQTADGRAGASWAHAGRALARVQRRRVVHY